MVSPSPARLRGAALPDDRRRRLRGTVEQSSHPQWKAGDKVVCNGWGMGETDVGGFARRRASGDWLVRLVTVMSRDRWRSARPAIPRCSSVLALEKYGLTPKRSGRRHWRRRWRRLVATALLSKLGYHVIASTGRMSEAGYLKGLGAAEVIDRNELSGPASRWRRNAGPAVSTGRLDYARRSFDDEIRGAIAACGLAAGMDLPSSVRRSFCAGCAFSASIRSMCPIEPRKLAWSRLATDVEKEN